MFEEILHSESHVMVQMRQAIEHNPILMEPNSSRVMDLVKHERCIFPTVKLVANYLAKSNCDIIGVPLKEITGKSFGFLFRKNSKLAETISRAVLRSESVIRYLVRRYESRTEQLCFGEEVRRPGSGLRLQDLMGILIILGCGVTCAICAIAMEHCRKRSRR